MNSFCRSFPQQPVLAAFATTAALTLAAPGAGAADLGSAPYVAPAPMAQQPLMMLPRDWSGLSVDVSISKPLNSQVKIWEPPNAQYVGSYALTGIHVGLTTAYLFQKDSFVIGPRIRIAGGVVESMPLDYTVRNNGMVTFGGEFGYAWQSLYLYGFAAGGLGWTSAQKLYYGSTQNTVSAYEVGAGLRYRIHEGWYAKLEASYITLGDQRVGPWYFDPKPYVGLGLAFGYQFRPL